MFLVDTNVWLELLLSRQHADEVRKFFQTTDASLLAITEFSLYSLGVILTRLKKAEIFEEFLSDVIEDSGVTRIRLTANELKQVLTVMRQSSFAKIEKVTAAGKNIKDAIKLKFIEQKPYFIYKNLNFFLQN